MHFHVHLYYYTGITCVTETRIKFDVSEWQIALGQILSLMQTGARFPWLHGWRSQSAELAAGYNCRSEGGQGKGSRTYLILGPSNSQIGGGGVWHWLFWADFVLFHSLTGSQHKTVKTGLLVLCMCQVFDSNILLVVYQHLPLRDEPKAYCCNLSCAKMHELNLWRYLAKMRAN